MDLLERIEKHFIWIAIGLALALIALAAYIIFSSLPPREFTILTGRQGGGYYAAAQKYQEIARERGFELKIQETSGSVETLRMLEAGEAQIGFVQGGVAIGADPQVLSTLSSVFYEPVWLFYRQELERDTPPEQINLLEGLRVAIGEQGSGTNQLTRLLLTENGLTEEDVEMLEVSSNEAAQLLQEGEIDAAFFVMSADTELVQRLLRDPSIRLANMRRAAAYQSRFPYLTSVTLPAGAIDLVNNLPEEDKQLISTVANVVVSNQLHPDLIRLMSIAVVETHESGGFFERRYEFPNFQYSDLPIGKEELAYVERIKSGESTLDNYFPFWAAALLDRLWLFVVPIAILFLPMLSRSSYLVTIYNRRKITRWYRVMRKIDYEMPRMTMEEVELAEQQVAEIERQLQERARITEVWMPDFYGLLEHLDLFKKRLQRRREELIAGATASESDPALAPQVGD